MSDWLHHLPVIWMALVIFAATYLAAGAIFAIIMMLAKGARAHIFRRISPGLLSPLGAVFGLLVVFVVFQVFSDFDRATMAVDREASALRTVLLLAGSFSGEPETQIRDLVRRHVDEAVSAEWPAMAKQAASLKVAAPALSEALRLALSLTPQSDRQIVARNEIVRALEIAMDARRERINLSHSTVNWVKWICMFAQAVCTLVAIAMIHSDNRAAAAIAMGIFATGVAVSALLIATHDRPFSGDIHVKPDVLLQVRPD
jgi:hypothetical protein